MGSTSVDCPKCGVWTDACPCWNCGHNFRDDEIQHLEERNNTESVAVQFAEVLEKQARHIRDTEDEILLLMKIDGIYTVIEDLLEAIIIDCKDERLLDESGGE